MDGKETLLNEWIYDTFLIVANGLSFAQESVSSSLELVKRLNNYQDSMLPDVGPRLLHIEEALGQLEPQVAEAHRLAKELLAIEYRVLGGNEG